MLGHCATGPPHRQSTGSLSPHPQASISVVLLMPILLSGVKQYLPIVLTCFSLMVSFPSLHSSHLLLLTSPLHQIHDPSITLQEKKKSGFPEVSTKHSRKFRLRLGTILHIEAGCGNPGGGEGFQEQAKESEIPPLLLLRVPQKLQSTQP